MMPPARRDALLEALWNVDNAPRIGDVLQLVAVEH
jgi:hypothetical protein